MGNPLKPLAKPDNFGDKLFDPHTNIRCEKYKFFHNSNGFYADRQILNGGIHVPVWGCCILIITTGMTDKNGYHVV